MLEEIALAAGSGLRPALHFDAHGTAVEGIRLAASGEYVSWPRLVASLTLDQTRRRAITCA